MWQDSDQVPKEEPTEVVIASAGLYERKNTVIFWLEKREE